MVSDIESIWGNVDCWISEVVFRNALIKVSNILASTNLLTLTVVNDFKTSVQTCGMCWEPGPLHWFDSAYSWDWLPSYSIRRAIRLLINYIEVSEGESLTPWWGYLEMGRLRDFATFSGTRSMSSSSFWLASYTWSPTKSALDLLVEPLGDWPSSSLTSNSIRDLV